jgi:hypothetical protein
VPVIDTTEVWKDRERRDAKPSEFVPRAGWTLDPKTPEGVCIVAVRTVRTFDGIVHKLYKLGVAPQITEAMRERLEKAEAEIRRSNRELEKIELLLAISKKRGDLERLEKKYAEQFSSGREEAETLVQADKC